MICDEGLDFSRIGALWIFIANLFFICSQAYGGLLLKKGLK